MLNIKCFNIKTALELEKKKNIVSSLLLFSFNKGHYIFKVESP